MKLLIIRLSSMGDVILATSLFGYLSRVQPDSELHFVTDKHYAELFCDDHRLASVTGVSRHNLGEAIKELAQRQWDLIVDLQNNRRTARILAHYMPSVSTGVFNKLHRERFALLTLRRDRYPAGRDVAARYLEAAGYHSLSRDDIPPLYLPLRGNGDTVNKIVENTHSVVRPMIALVPFSAWRNKQWPLSRFCTVGKYFQTNGWNVVVFGGPGDRRPARRLCEAIGGSCVSVAGEGSLYELGCLMKRCRLCFGNDTGLTHLARACGVRTGVIYGSTTRHFGFFPYGIPPYRVFETPLWCRPCHAHGGNVCPRLTRPCLRRIDPQSVIAGLEDLCISERAREVAEE
ncbi:MAG: hypothetical protein GF344_04025 [Chitinivibrionales bacterium]|nr:hypothetical protein [Chitinivibrionales bacterium]MBD3356221.1 hypothetical protein [Chitinivibrionales bacterium]